MVGGLAQTMVWKQMKTGFTLVYIWVKLALILLVAKELFLLWICINVLWITVVDSWLNEAFLKKVDNEAIMQRYNIRSVGECDSKNWSGIYHLLM